MFDYPTRIHIIGEPENGIVITLFDPFRVVTIGWNSIEEYAASMSISNPPSPKLVYQDLCYSLTMLVMDLSEGPSGFTAHEDGVHTPKDIQTSTPAMDHLKKLGVYLNDADLCLSARVNLDLHNHSMDGAGMTSRRFGYQMFHGLIDTLLTGTGSNPMEFKPHEDDEYSPGDGGHGHGGIGGDGHNH